MCTSTRALVVLVGALSIGLPVMETARGPIDTHFFPTILPKSGSGVTKPVKAVPKVSGLRTSTQTGPPARKELLFNLTCNTYDQPASERGLGGCIGVGPNHQCTRSLETDQSGALERPSGVGGPTGCKEAFLTVMGDDGFLAGVLLLLHTVRKYALVDRDFVVVVSTQVTRPTVELLLGECVRVVQLDPFYRNDLARQLVARSERYKSGYWVIKMFVWRLEEYSKLVYIDGDVYFRQSADELFCAPVSPTAPIAVTPRSSMDLDAGFNAGMFIYQPSRVVYQNIMDKFLGMKEEDMFATSEQDFLNEHFKDQYTFIPIDYLMKHRRMVKEKSLWDKKRVHGYHMNGNPKPWSPAWRIACAYPIDHQKFIAEYEDFFLEWWEYYYDYIKQPLPTLHSEFRLRSREDPTGRFASWDPKQACAERKDSG
eukprot:CAMPEP_0114246744 /NCGR_PEP_ID=MMETSP0058-20121206/12642_1 /TAXON_ID=36894 /ORGANISM="Pyramimonas parkeae, CCMP726" /LENGTH=425 /DNA_ID=CAMNT_0001359983 /DNA_START=344 /DNA_END=1621 /DNA_ORIENTATION=+